MKLAASAPGTQSVCEPQSLPGKSAGWSGPLPYGLMLLLGFLSPLGILGPLRILGYPDSPDILPLLDAIAKVHPVEDAMDHGR